MAASGGTKIQIHVTPRLNLLLTAIGSGLVGRGIALITPLLVMPSMLDYLGPVLFGFWLTAVALSAMASLLDFGIGNALLTRLSEAFGRDDLVAVRRILGDGYVLLGAISGGFILLTLGGYLLLESVGSTIATSEEGRVIAIVLIALFLSFPAGLITRLLQGRHAFIQLQLAQLAGPVLALILCLGGIRAGISPVGVVAAYAFAPAITLFIWSAAYLLRNPDHRPVFRALDWLSMRRLTSLGGGFFFIAVFSLIGLNADNVLIAARVGAETVAEYGVPARLGTILMLIVSTLFMPLWSLFGDALARNDQKWLNQISLRMSVLGGTGVLVFGLGLTWYVDPILTLWMGRPFADQELIMLGWTAAATVIAVTAPYNMVLNAAGMAAPQVLPWAVFLGVSVIAKALFLTEDTTWWAPWITAGVYLVAITPAMIFTARRRISKPTAFNAQNIVKNVKH